MKKPPHAWGTFEILRTKSLSKKWLVRLHIRNNSNIFFAVKQRQEINDKLITAWHGALMTCNQEKTLGD